MSRSLRYCFFLFFILCSLVLCSSLASSQPRHAANVLYAYKPLPIFAGPEFGATLTPWLNATPTFFEVRYPYSDGDTIHVRFPKGASPLFGTHLGVAADFTLSEHWGLLAKFNYNERRGNWNATLPVETGTTDNVTVNTDFTWMLRCATAEVYARYGFQRLRDLYVAGGLGITTILSEHYDLSQTLDGPADYSFVDFGTANGTGIRQYNVGGSNTSALSDLFVELKLLAGLPIHVGNRWTINPEVTMAVPLSSIWRSSMQKEYSSHGVSSPPSPLAFAGIIAFRFQLR